MRHLITRTVAVTVVSVALAACSSGGESAGAAPEGWVVHDAQGVSFAAPPELEVAELGAGDTLALLGPEGDGAPLAVRLLVGERDPVPFDELADLVVGGVAAAGLEPDVGAEEEIEVPGAELATALDLSYETEFDGASVEIEERLVIAWVEDGGQVVLRAGGPSGQGEVVDQVVATLDVGA